MSRKMDSIVVIDIESTCWKVKPPAGEESEIIEIGICLVDIQSGHPRDRESILVKPERSRVSPFCTELTTLTQQQVDAGISFAEACSILKSEYQSSDRVWASFGDYDRNMFEKQCKSRGIKYPFGPRHLNIKTLFALVYALPKEVGMPAALEDLYLPLEGTHHRGGDDAANIAKILSKLLGQARGKNGYSNPK